MSSLLYALDRTYEALEKPPVLTAEEEAEAELHDQAATVCHLCPQLVGFKDPHGCQETYCKANKDWRVCAEDAAEREEEDCD